MGRRCRSSSRRSCVLLRRRQQRTSFEPTHQGILPPNCPFQSHLRSILSLLAPCRPRYADVALLQLPGAASPTPFPGRCCPPTSPAAPQPARRKYEDLQKDLKAAEERKAKEQLEARRLERLRMDELMRNPASEPPPPRKPILKKGSKCGGSTPSTPGTPGSAASADVQRQRAAWRDGLRQHIEQQRQQSRQQSPPQVRANGGMHGSAGFLPLCWTQHGTCMSSLSLVFRSL